MRGAAYDSELRDRLVQQLSPVPIRRTTLAYRAGLVLAAIAMVALALLYLSLVALLASALYWHARHNVDRSLHIYIPSLLLGVAAIGLLLKPLLYPTRSQRKPLILSPSSEPLLFDFVAKLSEVLEAPQPTRIAVDTQANASAGFEGGLRGFLSNDFRLVIGLPLARSLTLDQFVGTVAHELGHFSQSGGMRISFLINTVNSWFGQTLAGQARLAVNLANDNGPPWHLWLVRLGVWLSRKAFYPFAWAGAAIGSTFSRQMEFDADTYEARLVGHRVVATTARALRRLGAAEILSGQYLSDAWAQGRLIRDLPEFIHDLRQDLDQGAFDKVAAKRAASWLDSHPSDASRIQRALMYPNGIFAVDLPATDLFRDFKALAARSTLHHYKEELGLDVVPERLASTEEMKTLVVARGNQQRAVIEALGFQPSVLVPILPSHSATGASSTDPSKTPPQMSMRGAATLLSRRLQSWWQVAVQAHDEYAWIALARASVSDGDLSLGKLTEQGRIQEATNTYEKTLRHERELHARATVAAQSLSQAIDRLVEERFANAPTEEIRGWRWRLHVLGGQQQTLLDLARDIASAHALLGASTRYASISKYRAALDDISSELRTAINALRSAWSVPAPPGAFAPESPAAILPDGSMDNLEKCVDAAMIVLHRADDLHEQCIGRLLTAGASSVAEE